MYVSASHCTKFKEGQYLCIALYILYILKSFNKIHEYEDIW